MMSTDGLGWSGEAGDRPRAPTGAFAKTKRRFVPLPHEVERAKVAEFWTGKPDHTLALSPCAAPT